MVWINMKQRFRGEDNRVIYANQKDDKNQIEIYSKREKKKMMDYAYKILISKNNRGLPRHMVITVPKKRSIVSRL